MARVYATTADYAAEYGTAPDNADSLLRDASRVIDVLLRGYVYDTDAAGMPSDADVVEAFKDATVAIAAEADSLGVTAPGSTRQWESVAIGSVQLSTLQGASDSDSPVVLGMPVPVGARLALGSLGRDKLRLVVVSC